MMFCMNLIWGVVFVFSNYEEFGMGSLMRALIVIEMFLLSGNEN